MKSSPGGSEIPRHLRQYHVSRPVRVAVRSRKRAGGDDGGGAIGGRQNMVVLVNVLCPRDRSEETSDLSDRAHNEYNVEGRDKYLLRRADRAAHATPRRYCPVNMCGPRRRRVEFGTVFEHTDYRQRVLARLLGAPLDRPGRAGVMADAVEAELRKYAPQERRDMVRRPLVTRSEWQSMTTSERRLHASANAILRAAKE